MLSSWQRADPECFTVFSQTHKSRWRTFTTPVSGTIQMTFLACTIWGEEGPSTFHCLHQVWISQQCERRCCPHATSHICSHSRQWHEFSCTLFLKDHNYALNTELCRLQVSFFYGRRYQELLRDPSSADINTGQARVLCWGSVTPAPDSEDCRVSASCEFGKWNQNERGTSGCFCFFCFAVF